MNFNIKVDPRVGQYLAVAAFALSSLALASWWQDWLSAKEAATAVGALNWVVAVMNFVLHGSPAPTGYFDDTDKAIAKAADPKS